MNPTWRPCWGFAVKTDAVSHHFPFTSFRASAVGYFVTSLGDSWRRAISLLTARPHSPRTLRKMRKPWAHKGGNVRGNPPDKVEYKKTGGGLKETPDSRVSTPT